MMVQSHPYRSVLAIRESTSQSFIPEHAIGSRLTDS